MKMDTTNRASGKNDVVDGDDPTTPNVIVETTLRNDAELSAINFLPHRLEIGE